MPRASGLPFLNLSPKNEEFNGLTPATLSPHSTGSPRTPGSVPGSPFLQEPPTPSLMNPLSASSHDGDGNYRMGPNSPRITAMPEFPPSPDPVPQSPKHGRETSKGFFSNLMASKSSHKLQSSEASIPEAIEKPTGRSRTSSKDRSLHSVKKQGSTPDLPKMAQTTAQVTEHTTTQPEPSSQQTSTDPTQGHRKGKSKFGGILARTKTTKPDEVGSKTRGVVPSQIHVDTANGNSDRFEASPKTAPIKADHRDRAFGHERGHATRNHSADRHIREETNMARKERQVGSAPLSSSLREGSTLQLLSNIHQTSKGMGDRLGKAGKGFFGKIARSGSSNEREIITDDSYVCTTINLPLVKQTRKTRIARRLELSKDKTEFWMPALPWRCIEYVNLPLVLEVTNRDVAI